MKKEIFKDVPGYLGKYQVSNFGNVKSLERFRNTDRDSSVLKERMFRAGVGANGYRSVVFYDGLQKRFNVSVLAAMTFLGHKPNGGGIVVDHRNNIKTDDRLENLQLITQRENSSKDRKGSSKYTGVSWRNQTKKWEAHIRINRKLKHLGCFTSEIKASKAYQKALLTK